MKDTDKNYKELYESTLKELEIVQKENSSFEKLKADKTFGITVCGDVLLNKLEVAIVNTQEFQRLRKIHQLGTTYMVYPSAVHTRFEHSLGVVKQVDEIIKCIRNNLHSTRDEKYISPEDEQIARLLALLHDIGHMPFGHTHEDEFGIFRSHDKHETRWEYLLGEASTIGKIIINEYGDSFHKTFFNLIRCEKDFHRYDLGEKAFLYDIVSNTVCADLLDYLSRDCLYTNLKLNYHPRFLNYFFIAEREIDYLDNATNITLKKKERRIGIRAYKKNNKKELRRDIISELIQLLRNRYYLGERVYCHHAKIMTGTLLAGAVLRAKVTNMFKSIKINDSILLTNIKNNSDNMEDKTLYNIHFMGDEDLIIFLKNLSLASKDEQQQFRIKGAINLATYYDNRILYKQLIYETKDSLGIEDDFDTYVINEGRTAKHYVANSIYNKFIRYGTASTKLDIEDAICEYLGMDSGDVLLYCPNFNMAMKLAKALMENDKMELMELRNFEDRNIKQECESIISKHQALWACRVYLHPKYFAQDNEQNKQIIDLIIKYFNWVVFAKDENDEKEKGEIFWESYYKFYLEKKEAENKKILETTNKMKRTIQQELTDELLGMPYGTRTYQSVCKIINERFCIDV